MTLREIAKKADVALGTVTKAKKDLGITSKSLSKKEINLILKKCKNSSELQKEKEKKLEVKSNHFKAKVRRIDKSESSSAKELLQDCKERYVANEMIIQRLQWEIDNQEILMHGNSNGTLSGLPQLKGLETFQKINISLRNQIMQLETELGKVAGEEEENPFA